MISFLRNLILIMSLYECITIFIILIWGMRKGGKCPPVYVDFVQNIIMKFAPGEKKGKQTTECV